MLRQPVIIRAMGDVALLRQALWGTDSAVYVTDHIGVVDLRMGTHTDRIMGFPRRDVFRYQPGIEDGTVPDWEKCLPYSEVELPSEDGKSPAAVELGRMGGLARAKSLTKADRIKIARTAALARWRHT